MKISVLTPTYNRGYCLQRLFKSLIHQTYRNFEWVIVDDGSHDDTNRIVRNFKSEDFQIVYLEKCNQGKHTAINYGMDYVSGDMVFIVDSDDWLFNDSLENIVKIENSIPSDEKVNFAGVCGLKVLANNNIVGNSIADIILDITTIEAKKQKIYGDKAEVYYTRILKEFPFPVFGGEKFLTEKIVWDKIASEGYKLRYFKIPIYVCEYLEDGLTNAGYNLYANNPIQWGYAIKQDIDNKVLNFYEASIQIYKYYLWEKERLEKETMIRYLDISSPIFYFSIYLNRLIDKLRLLIFKTSIINSIENEKSKNT